MRNQTLRYLQFGLIIVDIFVINLIVVFSHYFFKSPVFEGTIPDSTAFGGFLSLAWIAVAGISGVYNERRILSFEAYTKKSFYALFYFFGIVFFYLFLFETFNVSKKFLVFILSIISICIFLNRLLYLFVMQYVKNKDSLTKKVVILGYNKLSKKLVNYFENEDSIKRVVVGYCDHYENVHELSNYPILGNIQESLQISKQHGISEIYSTIAPEQNLQIYDLMDEADQACIHFRLIPDLSHLIKKNVHINYLNDMPVLSLRKEPLTDPGSRIKKRLFDIVISVFVIMFILSWLLPILALLIKLSSRGPVFFNQKRLGKQNKYFLVFKLRTMKVSTADNDFRQASKNDNRVTTIGRFLRKTSLDELPQFFNVLLGHMSVIGPRPHVAQLNDQYKEKISAYMVRHFLKPGISGWAQINGHRGETKTIEMMQKRIEHDIWYMENWTFWLDVKIMFLTIFQVLKSDKSAY